MNPEDIAAFIAALKQNASRLGLTWTMATATVVNGLDPKKVSVTFDGDSAIVSDVSSAIGQIITGTRVYVIQAPPAGNYIMGIMGKSQAELRVGGYYTGGAAAATSVAGAEAVIPAATWTVEPGATFAAGHLYEVGIQGRISAAAGTLNGTNWVRLRKGSAAVAGTVLTVTNLAIASLFEALAFNHIGYVKNVSGVDVTTKLSVTIQHVTGAAGNTSITGDANMPLLVTVKDIGVADDQFLSAIAGAV